MTTRTPGKWMGSTGWMLVHPTKGPWKKSIDFREDRPGGLLVMFTKWRWQRVLITPDHFDAELKNTEGK